MSPLCKAELKSVLFESKVIDFILSIVLITANCHTVVIMLIYMLQKSNEVIQLSNLLLGYRVFNYVELHTFSHGSTAPSGPLSTLHDHTQTHHIRQDFSGRVISPPQRLLRDNIQQSRETSIHTPGGIRTRNPSNRAATDPRHSPRGHFMF
jgi:hypothetical protein